VTDPVTSPFASIEEAIEEIRAGRFVVVVDDEDRENEGDLTIAAQFVTPESVNFMATHGRGLICLALTAERCDELGLRQMTDQNEAQFGTAFTVSIEAREGVSTGISAADRALTIQVAVDPTSTPHDIVQPGHIFPLRLGGGVLRRGQAEAASTSPASRSPARRRRLRDHERGHHGAWRTSSVLRPHGLSSSPSPT
jgi:3,4-dihydroxy 2-butanone 4-phosphate synthase/GTP cyclohydrolase II